MHESSLMKDLLRKIVEIADENGSDLIASVTVRLGALSQISPEHFREHFDHAVSGTIVESAELRVEISTDLTDPQAQKVVLESVELG